jgi:hypothetical protein
MRAYFRPGQWGIGEAPTTLAMGASKKEKGDIEWLIGFNPVRYLPLKRGL